MIRKPGVRSSIELLDKELLDTVNQLIKDGHTIREMVDKLRELGVTVSKSAMGRYAKRASDQMERYKEAQEVAKFWVDAFEKEPDGDVGGLLKEMLKTVAFSTMASMNESEKPIKAGDIMSLSIAIKNLSATDKETLNIAILRKQVQQQAQQVADKVSKEVMEAGLSEEKADYFRTKILGIAQG